MNETNDQANHSMSNVNFLSSSMTLCLGVKVVELIGKRLKDTFPELHRAGDHFMTWKLYSHLIDLVVGLYP